MRKLSIGGNGIVEGVIWKEMLAFFFPILFGTFFQQLYNTVDAIVVGNFVGKEALAAVGGSSSTFINLLLGFFIGLASGATVLISQFYGARDAESTQKAVHTAVALALASGGFLMIIGQICAPYVLRAMGTPEDIMEYTLIYMRVYFLGMIPNLFYNVGTGILRAIGDSRRPLYFLITSTMVNLVLDLVFVLQFHMGVLGVAMATILAQTISALMILFVLVRTTGPHRLFIRKIGFTRNMLFDIIRIGIPAGLQSVMYGLSNLIIQISVNSFGTDMLAAWTAYGKIDSTFWMVMDAFGVTISTFVAQNFGAQQYSRMRKSVRVCMGMTIGTTIMISSLQLIFGRYIYRLFTNDPVVIDNGMEILYMMVPFYITYIGIAILCSAVRGTGDAIIPMIITCTGVCVLRIVWILLVTPWNPTIQMVLASYPITWSITSLLFVGYYLQGGWLRRQIARKGFPPEQKKEHNIKA
ncbi:MAG: MATE family efflux transporter [Candidatus Merdivicinus sp.]